MTLAPYRLTYYIEYTIITADMLLRICVLEVGGPCFCFRSYSCWTTFGRLNDFPLIFSRHNETTLLLILVMYVPYVLFAWFSSTTCRSQAVFSLLGKQQLNGIWFSVTASQNIGNIGTTSLLCSVPDNSFTLKFWHDSSSTNDAYMHQYMDMLNLRLVIRNLA